VLYAEDNPMNVELVREVMHLRPDCRLVVKRGYDPNILTVGDREPRTHGLGKKNIPCYLKVAEL